MKIKFYAEDGKMFDTKKECLDYEESVRREEEKKIELEKKQQDRYREVKEAYKHYKTLLDAYLDDYEEYSYSECDDEYPFLNALFRAFNL